MLGILKQLILFLSATTVSAMVVGNPAEPALLEKGIFFNCSRVSLRFGYLDDWIYKQRFQEEFLISEKTRTNNQLSTYAGMATLNFMKRFDVYGYLGSSRMQVDDQIFANRTFSWCVGSKVMFLKHKNLFFGADVKYFETIQKPKYFVIDELPFNIMSACQSKYFDIQAALGMAYKIGLFVPYFNATYIHTHISPEPPVVLVRFPEENEISDVEIPSLVSRKNWGFALGFSLVDVAQMTLALEWRALNQNAINVNGEIRF